MSRIQVVRITTLLIQIVIASIGYVDYFFQKFSDRHKHSITVMDAVCLINISQVIIHGYCNEISPN